MNRPAMDVMHDVVLAAVLDAIVALKAASKGMPNALLRDLNAVHPNTTFADLPKELQAAIQTSTRGAFTRLLKEGYSVADAKAPPPRPQVRPAGSDNRRPSSPPRGRGPRPEGGRPSGPRRPGGGGGRGGQGPRGN